MLARFGQVRCRLLFCVLLGSGATAQSTDPALCFPSITLLERGQPKAYWDGVSQTHLTPLVKGSEVYLPLRFLGTALGLDVVQDVPWNVFSVGGRLHFRLNVKETHEPAAMMGGVKGVAVNRYDVAPFYEKGRIYVPLKMLPALFTRAVRDADGTLRLVRPADCP